LRARWGCRSPFCLARCSVPRRLRRCDGGAFTSNPPQRSRPGGAAGELPHGTGPGVLVGSRLNVGQRCARGARRPTVSGLGSGMGWAAGAGQGSWRGRPSSAALSSGPLTPSRTWRGWSVARAGQPGWGGGWRRTSPMRSG